MSYWQYKVAAFHHKFGHPVGDFGHPQFRRAGFRLELMAEELQEIEDAIDDNDFPAAVDGVMDLIYTAVGSLVEWGVDGDPVFDEVHHANMNKERNPNGNKPLKPEGWREPDIDGVLQKQVEGVRARK